MPSARRRPSRCAASATTWRCCRLVRRLPPPIRDVVHMLCLTHDVHGGQMLPRNERPREKLVEDRTGCHADMSGLYPERHAVAAVGLVQGMRGVHDLKDIIAFHAGDMDRLAEVCGLYFQEVRRNNASRGLASVPTT